MQQNNIGIDRQLVGSGFYVFFPYDKFVHKTRGENKAMQVDEFCQVFSRCSRLWTTLVF